MPLRHFSSAALLSSLALALVCWSGAPASAQPPNAPKGIKGVTGKVGQQPPAAPQPDQFIQASPEEIARFNGIQWQQGPCLAKMREIGQVQLPAGYKFTGEAGCRTLMDLTHNLQSNSQVGIVCPSTFNPLDIRNKDWFVVFDWDNIGYVKDEEKNELDANAIFQSLVQAQEKANAERSRLNMPTLSLTAWEQAPFYDPQTNHLSWGTRVRANDNGVEAINFNARLLGRGGVMSVQLVVAPELFQAELPKFKDIIKGYSFQPGQTYAEWRAGDKVAAYGLTALISGGAVALAAKSGLLAKLGKFIVYIVIGVATAVGAVFKKFFGRRSAGEA